MLSLHFVRSQDNLADFLTREGLREGDMPRFNLKYVTVSDFYDVLPKSTFSLQEWCEFCSQNPQYLQINDPLPESEIVKSATFALNAAVENIKATVSPLIILQERLERGEFIKNQKKELNAIYKKCLNSKDFTYEDEIDGKTTVYKLESDLMFIKKEDFKIYVPPSMVGLLLSQRHLLGHRGLAKMLLDLELYYFPKKTDTVKRFISACYSCFLANPNNQKSKIGLYPAPSRAFEEITLDLAENLNAIGGFQHLLIIQCALTNFLIICPLKTKTANEVSRALFNSVLQQHNVSRIHSDNGPAFRDRDFLKLLAAMRIKVIGSAALHPEGRGQIEKSVGLTKLLLKKMLATRPTFNWEYLPFLVAKFMNNTKNVTTQLSPNDMVYGKNSGGLLFLDNSIKPSLHYTIKDNINQVERLTAELAEMTTLAQDRLMQIKLKRNYYINKSRVQLDLKSGDYVFHVNQIAIPGNPRQFKTRLSESPFIVIKPLFTTTLIRRLSDGFTALYRNADLKKYDPKNAIFKDLPIPVNKALLHNFADLVDTDLVAITTHDKLEIPQGIELQNLDEKQELDEDEFPDDKNDELNDDNHDDNDDDDENIDDRLPITYILPNVQKDDAKQEAVQKAPKQKIQVSVPTENTQKIFDRDEPEMDDLINNELEKNEMKNDLKALQNDDVANTMDVTDEFNSDDENIDNDDFYNLRSGPLGRRVTFK